MPPLPPPSHTQYPPDFAVGAPYQELEDGNSGKVFIYYGSSAFTNSTPGQVLYLRTRVYNKDAWS